MLPASGWGDSAFCADGESVKTAAGKAAGAAAGDAAGAEGAADENERLRSGLMAFMEIPFDAKR